MVLVTERAAHFKLSIVIRVVLVIMLVVGSILFLNGWAEVVGLLLAAAYAAISAYTVRSYNRESR
jgi:CHASE2 domain-containing sensor protein